jgi:hypothetical protein
LVLLYRQSGTNVPQLKWEYLKRTNPDGFNIYPLAKETFYRNTNGAGGLTTTVSWGWQSTSFQPESVTLTLPTVTTAQNGRNSTDTITAYFDTFGRLTWAKDGDGYITYREYDSITGAMTKYIEDVNTATTLDFTGLPSGWSTPTGGGLHLKSTYEVDGLDRTTTITDPNTNVTYIVYEDTDHEVRVYRGWDSGTNLPTDPTEVYRTDRTGGYTESLTMSATPNVSGGRPTGTESISSLQTLSRSYTNLDGQVTSVDNSFSLSGLTYTTYTTLGTQNIHYYRRQVGYDHRGRNDRVVSGAGTIYRTVYDGQSRVTSEWVGLDDTPLPASGPPVTPRARICSRWRRTCLTMARLAIAISPQ